MSLSLTVNERLALQLLQASGGAVLVTAVPDRAEKEIVFGGVKPGHPTYKKLEHLGLCFYAEVDPVEGFEFTPEIYITDEGKAALAAKS